MKYTRQCPGCSRGRRRSQRCHCETPATTCRRRLQVASTARTGVKCRSIVGILQQSTSAAVAQAWPDILFDIWASTASVLCDMTRLQRGHQPGAVLAAVQRASAAGPLLQLRHDDVQQPCRSIGSTSACRWPSALSTAQCPAQELLPSTYARAIRTNMRCTQPGTSIWGHRCPRNTATSTGTLCVLGLCTIAVCRCAEEVSPQHRSIFRPNDSRHAGDRKHFPDMCE